jgi:cyclohexanecarboxylate-CoA ligase
MVEPLITRSDALRCNPAPGQDIVLTDAHAEQYRTSGAWPGRTVRSLLTEAAQLHPERTAVVGYSDEGTDPVRVDYRRFDELAHRAAWALAHLDVGEGDAVAVMLPNWLEFAALVYGIAEAGGVYVGVPVASGERETFAILQRSKAKVLVVPCRWRRPDPLGLARRLRKSLPNLATVIVADPARPEPQAGAELQQGEVFWSALQDLPERHFAETDPARVFQFGFTSGTTGEPKGVMNTHDVLQAALRNFAAHIGHRNFGTPMVQMVASPTGHHSGFIWGILLTAYLQGTAVFVERWVPQQAASIIRTEKVTAMLNAPTFIQDLMATDLAGDPTCTLQLAVLAGAPVPRGLPSRAGEAFGADICPAWGMTEYGIAISCAPDLPTAARHTDGIPVPGAEVRIVDPDEHPVAVGVVGDLLVRGPGLFLGYYDRPDETARAFTGEGWFRTGDKALRDEQGYICLRGRSKDIIIRGGENIPVADVENAIIEHPDILNGAVVGYPDERLGERAAAVVVCKPGTSLDLPALCTYLLANGVSKHYLPELLDTRSELPMTMSGKIRKFELRRELAAQVDEATA